jgi:hypothetical protein
MNYDVLHNFISPVTGRVLCKEDYILVGNRDNIADPSPALIDTKLDLIKLRHDVNELLNATFILEEANFKLPKAQALNILDDGFMYNTGGIISTTNDIPLPNLEYKHLWIGDSNNQPQAVTTIDIDNLPSLGTTNVPTPTGGFVGKVWEGTSSGRPEESSIVGEMFADIGILNAKFLAGHFVMNSGLTASFPAAQFLNALTAGALVKTSSTGNGKLETITLNQDQVLMGGANNTPESRARIGVENLPLLADKKLWSGNSDSIPQSITTIDISNLPNLEQNKLWIGDAGNRPVAQSTLNIDNLPNLTNNRVWQGNAQGRPEEVELNFAPVDATYIIKQPNVTLTNAQVLSELGVGIAKIVAGGAFAIAIPDEDYATKATLEQIKAETEEFKNQAATSAEEASASATEAASSATEAAASATEATAAAGEATAAAAEATGAAAAASGSAIAAGISAAGAAASALAAGASAGSASSSASDASSSASNAHNSAVNSASSASQSLQYLNQLLNTGINLVGDVLGSGPLKDPITLTFKANPTFTGTGSMTIPVGTTSQRPNNPVLGMTRINTDL